MPVVALPPSRWAATLRTVRELTRVAATALVLIVGVNGPAVTAPYLATPAAGRALTTPAASRALTAPAASPALAAPTAYSRTAVTAGTPGQVSTARHPLPAAATPATGVPDARAGAAPAAPGAATAVAAADPGRDALARRGPPRA